MMFLVSDAMANKLIHPKYTRYKIQLPQYNWYENSFFFSWKTLKGKIDFHFVFRTTAKIDIRFVAAISQPLSLLVFSSLALPCPSHNPSTLGPPKRQVSFTHLQ